MVKSLAFGDRQIPIPGFGAMGMSSGMGYNLSLEEAEPVLLKAIELGCTFWDTAVSKCIISFHSDSSDSRNTDFKCDRSFTEPVSMKSSLETSSVSTMSVTKYSVS